MIGRKIRQRRTELGISQEKLGEHLGVTFQQVQKYERGHNRVSCGTLAVIASKFEKPVTWFFDNLCDEPTESDAGDKETLSIVRTFRNLPKHGRTLVLNLARGLEKGEA